MSETSKSTFTSSIRLKLREPARLRNLELVLLVVAIGIMISAMALVQLGAQGVIDASVLLLTVVLGVLILGMHVTLRIVAPDADPLILPVITVLNGLGVAMIYRIGLADDAAG